jgi:hypothetical protein
MTHDGQFIPITFYQALWSSVYPAAASYGEGKSLRTICNTAAAKFRGPVIVLPEETTSNGKGLLICRSVERIKNIHFVGFK